jgi:hypothetical protein
MLEIKALNKCDDQTQPVLVPGLIGHLLGAWKFGKNSLKFLKENISKQFSFLFGHFEF